VDAALPERIGAYLIEAVLGHGGMGVVYRAHRDDGTKVALKVLIHPDSTQFFDRFLREAKIRIDHPNVVRIEDAGVDPLGLPYIAFEYLEGETLKSRLLRGPMSLPSALEMGKQILRGLSAAHAAGIIHRDVKPGNIFCLGDGRYKLFDFGIAIGADIDGRMTRPGAVVGTTSYLSPEQVKGRIDLDPRTDIWSVGVVLFEAMTGIRPFDRDGMIATLVSVLSDSLPAWPRHTMGLTQPIVDAIEHALKKERSERWPSAEAFAHAIEEAELAGDVPLDRTDEEPPRIRADERRFVAVLLASGVDDRRPIDLAVARRGGIPIPLLGGRALGVFGGETWQGDEVFRAASAAIEARRAADRFSIASGRASATKSGVSGEVLDAAEAALEHDVAGVAVVEEVARAYFTDLPKVAPGVFELSAADLRTEPRRDWMSYAPLLGVDAEVVRMRASLDALIEDQRGSVILVVGPSGVGKTRLREVMEEMLASSAPHIPVFSARAEPLSEGAQFALIAQAIRRRIELSGEDTTPVLYDTGDVTEVPAARAPARPGPSVLEGTEVKGRDPLGTSVSEAICDRATAESCAEFLRELLGISREVSDAVSAARKDAQLMSDRFRLAIGDYLDGLVSRGPVALVLEDLQWADAGSLLVIERLVEAAGERPFFLFLSARPELLEAFAVFDRPSIVRLEPRPLTTSLVGELADRCAKRPLSDALKKAIAERTGGNPFFVQEIVRAIDDETRGPALASLVASEADPAALPLPLTVEAAVQSRLDHLSDEARELTKRAAILGRPFTLVEIAALGIADPERHLGLLLERGLLRRTRADATKRVTYRFPSSLFADVALRMLSVDVKKALHARAAAALEESGAPAEEVARHHESGGALGNAAAGYAEATRRAARRGDSASVTKFSERALALGVTGEARFEVLMARGDALRFLGRPREQEAVLVEAASVASNDRQRAMAKTELAALLSSSGATDRARVEIESAVRLARAAADPEILALALGRRVLLLAWSARAEEARVDLEEAVALAEKGPVHLRALAATWCGQLATARGDLGEMRRGFSAALRLNEIAGDVRRAAGSATNLADAFNRVGAYREGVASLEDALRLCLRVGHRIMEGYALANLGHALTMLGRFADARMRLEEAGGAAESTNQRRLAVIVQVYVARLCLERGDLERALTEARTAAERAENAKLADWAALANAILSRVLLALGRMKDALETSKRAMKLLDSCAGAEDEAEIYLALRSALLASGDREEADRVLARGRKRVVAIADGISDPEWRLRFLSDVRAHAQLLSP
jgi:tetratricopeptide (TPR) repeat protein